MDMHARSGFNIVNSCVYTLSHDYTTALTIYGYVCAYTPQSDFNIVYSCVHTLSFDYTTALTIYVACIYKNGNYVQSY